MATFAPGQTYPRPGENFSYHDEFYGQPYYQQDYRPMYHSSVNTAEYIDPQRLSMGSPITPLSPPMFAYQPGYRPTCEQRSAGEWYLHSQPQEPSHFAQGLKQIQTSYDQDRLIHSQRNIPGQMNNFHSNCPLTPPLSPTTTLVASSASSITHTPTTPTHYQAQLAAPHPCPPYEESHNQHQQPSQTKASRRLSVPTSRTSASERHYCQHPSCVDQGTGISFKSFSRRADLQRHRACDHDRGTMFSCPRNNCHRKGSEGFTRKDHLIEHRRGYHGEDIPMRGSRAGTGKKDKKRVTKS